jgi:hypothetical protein
MPLDIDCRYRLDYHTGTVEPVRHKREEIAHLVAPSRARHPARHYGRRAVGLGHHYMGPGHLGNPPGKYHVDR